MPGMEDLVPKLYQKKERPPTKSEIQTIIKEILATKEQARTEEVQPKMETTVVKPKAQPTGNIKLTENALHVLEKRYLKKDKQGKVTETPEEMLHRVAHLRPQDRCHQQRGGILPVDGQSGLPA